MGIGINYHCQKLGFDVPTGTVLDPIEFMNLLLSDQNDHSFKCECGETHHWTKRDIRPVEAPLPR